MERRPLGRTGEQLSIVGFGGIIVRDVTPQEAAAFVAEAVDAGVNYFDVAPSYGNAEERLGPALAPHRDGVFLACKTARRDRDGAALELRQSLGRMQTDHFDLYQLHALTTDDDVRQAFGPKGALEALVHAKELGLVRHLGFSAHSEAAALEAMETYGFDSILFPVNYLAWTQGGFGQQTLAAAERLNMGRLALKALALGRLRPGETTDWTKAWYTPLDDPQLAAASLRWTLARGVTAAVSPGHIELFRLAVQAAQEVRAPADDELTALAQALDGRPPIFERT